MSRKILVDSNVLLDTLTRINCCAALLVRDIKCALCAGVPREKLLCEVGACDLLEAIAEDFYKEITACIGAESEAQKHSRQSGGGKEMI